MKNPPIPSGPQEGRDLDLVEPSVRGYLMIEGAIKGMHHQIERNGIYLGKACYHVKIRSTHVKALGYWDSIWSTMNMDYDKGKLFGRRDSCVTTNT